MNLPHLAPVRFAQEVVSHSEEQIQILCVFPNIPTLPMLAEAAAQSTSAFSNSDTPKIGFLVSLKDVILLEDIVFLEYLILVKSTATIGTFEEFYFEVFDNKPLSILNKKLASGKLVISIRP